MRKIGRITVKKYHNLDINLYHLKEEPENINITKIKTLDIVGKK